jgi:hypothetical protein
MVGKTFHFFIGFLLLILIVGCVQITNKQALEVASQKEDSPPNPESPETPSNPEHPNIQVSNEIKYNIEDKCGKFMNMMSHSIPDENSCIIRCQARCESMKLTISHVEFGTFENKCNYCACYCK